MPPLGLGIHDEALEAAARRPTLTPGANEEISSSRPFPSFDDDLELPERLFFDKLEERARRAELLTALLSAGGVSPANAVLTIQAALGAVADGASEAGIVSLSQLAAAIRKALGHLGVGGEPRLDDELHVVDTLVFDESELQRDLVALAVEGQGHTVRCASSYDEFVRELDRRVPGLIVTEVDHDKAPPRAFCSTLKDLLADKRVPVVLFSGIDEGELRELARKIGARKHMTKDGGIDALMTELREVYRQILATRTPRRRAPFRHEGLEKGGR